MPAWPVLLSAPWFQPSPPRAFLEFPAWMAPAIQHTNTTCHPWRHTGTPPQVSAQPLRGLSALSPLLESKASLTTFPTPAPSDSVPSRSRSRSSSAQASLTYQVSASHDGGNVSSLSSPGRVRNDREKTSRKSSGATPPDLLSGSTGGHSHCRIQSPLPGGRPIITKESRSDDVNSLALRSSSVTFSL